MSNIVDLIRKKRDGQTFSKQDICDLICKVVSRKIEQCQLGAMLMAVFLNGMTGEETELLTRSMIASGRTFKWPSSWAGTLVDKHSTGGVGDKISLILTPGLAACGLKVPMITGRGLGFTGGTLDKMESIPGYKVCLDVEQITTCVDKAGCCIAGQTDDIVPADRILYECRGITSTVDCVPLICSSIISKKAAESVSALVLDIKVGEAAFMADEEKAIELADNLVSLARKLDIKSVALITSMNWPIGCYIGNALEVAEAVYALNGRMEDDVKELVLMLGAHLLLMTGKVETLEDGSDLLWRRIADGSALKRFKDLLVCQGVEESIAEQLTIENADVWQVLPSANFKSEIEHAGEDGYIRSIDARTLADVCLELGTGRTNRHDIISYSAGLQLKVQVGQRIQKGVVWLIVHHDRPLGDETLEKAKSAIAVGQEQVSDEELKRVLKVVG